MLWMWLLLIMHINERITQEYRAVSSTSDTFRGWFKLKITDLYILSHIKLSWKLFAMPSSQLPAKKTIEAQ